MHVKQLYKVLQDTDVRNFHQLLEEKNCEM